MRNKGEGSFFYDHSAGRWVGKIGSIKVTSKDKTAAKAKWNAAKQKHAAGGKTSTAPRIADLLEALTDQKRQQSKTASTVGWYEGLASTHLAPLVGVRADSLSVESKIRVPFMKFAQAKIAENPPLCTK